jgi:hypothetical protein
MAQVLGERVIEMLTVSLGEVPRQEELEEALELIWEREPALRSRQGLQGGYGLLRGICQGDIEGEAEAKRALAEFVLDALGKVRAKEGLLFQHVDGASLAGAGLRKGEKVAVLTVLGVHGNQSTYIVWYEQAEVERDGRPPYTPFDVVHRLSYRFREELQVIHRGLLARYPALREVDQQCQNPDHPTVPMVATVERGQVTFVINGQDKAEYVLIGDAVFEFYHPEELSILGKPGHAITAWINRKRWRKFRYYDTEKVLWGGDEEINRDLCRRTLLGHLPRGMVLDLLRGKGDPEEVKQILAIVKLADL